MSKRSHGSAASGPVSDASRRAVVGYGRGVAPATGRARADVDAHADAGIAAAPETYTSSPPPFAARKVARSVDTHGDVHNEHIAHTYDIVYNGRACLVVQQDGLATAFVVRSAGGSSRVHAALQFHRLVDSARHVAVSFSDTVTGTLDDARFLCACVQRFVAFDPARERLRIAVPASSPQLASLVRNGLHFFGRGAEEPMVGDVYDACT